MKFVFLLAALLAPVLSQASEAVMKPVPEKPIVITADAKGTKAPWFMFRVNFKNEMKSPITILGLALTITDTRPDGSVLRKWVNITPSDFYVTVPAGDIMHSCHYTHFGVYESHDEKILMLEGDPLAACRRPANFMIGELPSHPGSQYNYQVEMKALGWMGTYENPEARFEKSVTFETQ